MKSIKIKDIHKTTTTGFNLTVSHLELYPNRIYGLVGPNGAGKTTLMKCLCGLLNTDSGSLEIDGIPVKMNDVALLKKVGTNFINAESLAGFTLSDLYNDHLFYYNQKNPISIEQLLIDVGLRVAENCVFNEMSLGMKQRFLLGLTTVHKPSIILLDEPFNGLDPDGVDLFIKHIKLLSKTSILIISSHVLKDLETFLDDVIFIDNGCIKETKSIATIKKEYQKGLKGYYDEQKHTIHNSHKKETTLFL